MRHVFVIAMFAVGCLAVSFYGRAGISPGSAGISPGGTASSSLRRKPQENGSNTHSRAPEGRHNNVHRFTGTASCAASNCHGGGGLNGIKGSEYSLWVQEDPHSRADTVLFNNLSRRMAERLDLTPADGTKRQNQSTRTPAHQAQECLVCHVTNANIDNVGESYFLAREDGVGCESCHGAADDWLGPHVRVDWKAKSPDEKTLLGFRSTKNVLARARLCATCHVGNPGGEVNHDLIAAGHPRLFFEFSAFHANMPAHWHRDDERAAAALDSAKPTKSYFEAKLWAVGQVASAEAALLLLESRSDDKSGTWPELSEYDCFACHHDLASPSGRQRRGFGTRRPGELVSNSWYFPLLPMLAEEYDGPDLRSDDSAFNRLNRAMRLFRRKQANEFAGQLRNQLSQWAKRLDDDHSDAVQFSTAKVRAALQRLLTDGQSLSGQNWDSATQWYLAVAAMNQAYRDASRGFGAEPTDEEIRFTRSIDAIQSLLEYPTGFDSPKSLALPSNSADTVEEINQHLKTMQLIFGN